MSDEPRSIRLNKTHRFDMLSAVMKQWEKANPSPAGATFSSFVKETLRTLMAVSAKAPAEQRAMKQLAKRTQDAIKVRSDLPENLKNHVTFNTEPDFRLQVLLENGDKGAVMTFCLPTAMADELKIPYIGAVTTHSGASAFPEYQDENNRVRFALMLNDGGWNTLTIPRDFKPYKTYKDSQRAYKQWLNDRDQVRGEIEDYLNQFNTTGQIRDGWPEMTDYLPAHIADPAKVIQLPALTRSRLNERLGIQ